MTWDALGAIGSFGQFLVVLAAAFFGFAQLRHARRQNELQATIPYFAYTRTPEFLEAFRIVRSLTTGDREDVTLREAIASADLSDERVVKLFNLANFFNELGVFVQEDMVDADVVLPFFAWQVTATWETFRPYVLNRRLAGVAAMMLGFEVLAVRSRETNLVERRYERARQRLPARLRPLLDQSVASFQSTDAVTP